MSKSTDGVWKLTIQAEAALRNSQRRAYQFFHENVEPIHLLLGLLESGGNGNAVLRHLGIDCQRVFDDTVQICREMPFRYFVQMGGRLPQSKATKATLHSSKDERCRQADAAITTAHLLCGLASGSRNAAVDLIRDHGLTAAMLLDHSWVVRDAIQCESDGGFCELGGESVTLAKAEDLAAERHASFEEAWRNLPQTAELPPPSL